MILGSKVLLMKVEKCPKIERFLLIGGRASKDGDAGLPPFGKTELKSVKKS